MANFVDNENTWRLNGNSEAAGAMKKRIISVHCLTKGKLQAFNDGWDSRKKYACDLDYFLGINALSC